MRNIYETYQQTTPTEQQVPDLGQVHIIYAVGLNVLPGANLHPRPDTAVQHYNNK